MSSATSIEKSFRLKPDATAKPGAAALKPGTTKAGGAKDPSGEPPGAEDAGFRPWHFFVLASLMSATAAVIMSRQSTPEHLVLISLTIGAAGLAAAGFYRTLAPLATEDVSMFSEALTERTRAMLAREKALALRSIKELEFDRAMGKLGTKDFDEMAGRLRARAIALMKQLEEDDAGYRLLIERELNARLVQQRTGGAAAVVTPTTSATCQACGTANDTDAAFCKRCGARLVTDERAKDME